MCKHPFPSSLLVLILSLSILISCGSPKPIATPTSALAEANVTLTSLAPVASVPTDRTTPAAINTPLPTDTATATPTTIVTPTKTVAAKSTAPANSGLAANVWLTDTLINYYRALGAYPPEPPLPRADNIDPLTGLPVSDPALLQRRPILARIMNDPSARPQTGLNQAELVFEEPIDEKGGFFPLTRLTAVYLANDATIRPFRSARLVFANLGAMFDGALASSGGSDGTRLVLQAMDKTDHIVQLDQFFADSAYCKFGGDAEAHSLTWVASTVSHLHEYLQSKNRERAVPLRGFTFADNATGGRPVTSLALDKAPWPVSIAGKVEWRYDAGRGRYLRFINGVAHNSLSYSLSGTFGGRAGCQPASDITSEQISAANVVVLYAALEQTAIVEDSLGFTNVQIILTGSGKTQVLRDGVMIEGRWQRPTLQHFFQFLDANGNVIPLKPGNTWFEIVPTNLAPTIK